jgi:membrane protease YdiL (CAAX protease family)
MDNINFKQKLLLGLIPYISVLIFMYYFSNAIITIFVYHLAVLYFLFSQNVNDLSKKIAKGWNFYPGIALILLGSISGILINTFWNLAVSDNSALTKTLMEFGLGNIGWIIFVIYYILLNPLIEELFWRGLLDGKGIKFLLVDLLFAGYHTLVLIFFIKIEWAFIAAIIIFIASVVWRKIDKSNNGIIISYLSHLAADISIIIAINLNI